MNKLIVFLLFLASSCTSSHYHLHGNHGAKSEEALMSAGDKELSRIDKLTVYLSRVRFAMEQNDPEEAWFNLCGESKPNSFSVMDAIDCHDEFVKRYFPKTSFNQVLTIMSQEELKKVSDNYFLYPSFVAEFVESQKD